MRDIIEILYDDCEPMLNEDDSSIMKLAKVKMEYLDMLEDSMTCEQKELRSALSEVECKIDDIMDIGRFRYAFHLGAQLMAELIEGKNYLLEKINIKNSRQTPTHFSFLVWASRICRGGFHILLPWFDPIHHGAIRADMESVPTYGQ